MGMLKNALAFTLVLGVAACAQTPMHSDATSAATAGAHPAIDYQRFIKDSATSFDFQHLSDWDSPDPLHVVVWTTPNQPYLLSLYSPCYGLADAATIVLSTHGLVMAGRDAVMVQGERCSIQRIDRLDGRRLKAAMAR